MNSKRGVLLVCFALCMTLKPPLVYACPASCTCDVAKREEEDSDSRAGRREVVCQRSGLTNTIPPDTVPEDTIKLDLSYNDITVLRRNSFQGLTSLQKLDLSHNKISYIEARTFDGLDAIQSIDLSSNMLGIVNNSMFRGMESVKRLNLSSNQISTISEATFDRLLSLEKIDFSSDLLVCDCNLKWIVQWKKTKGVRISENTVCAYPQSLRGTSVKTLKKRDLHCDWPLELPVFEIDPDESQVVFRGDTIPITCKATYLDESERIVWLKNGEPVTSNQKAGIVIETNILEDQSLIQSTLTVYHVNANSSAKGAWEFECQVITSRGNMRKHVTVIVMDGAAPYCEQERTRNNKGEFDWPKTFAGLIVKIECPHGPGSMFNKHMSAQANAERTCSVEGQWKEVDTAQCQYADTVTKKLETVSLMDFTNASIALSTAELVKQMTADGRKIKDPEIVVFVGKMFETLSNYWNRGLGEILIEIASNLMDADPNVLRQSQVMDRSCNKIILTLEKFASNILHEKDEPFNKVVPNIALEAFQVTAESFNGRNCALFVSGQGLIGNEDQYFKCFPGNISMPHVNINSMSIEASIQLPANIFQSVHNQPSQAVGSGGMVIYKLQFFVYKNGNLFPTITNVSSTADDRGRRTVTSHVISSKIANYTVANLERPAILSFNPDKGGKDTVAAYWDFEAEGNKGAWKTDGCKLVHEAHNFTQVQCNHLTNFAILKDMNSYSEPSGIGMGAVCVGEDCFLHPAIYVGSWIFVVFVFLTLVTYIVFHRNIRMKRKCRHSLMNICLAMLLLVSFYAGGVNRLRPERMCQIIGIGIHYFSICSLIWMAIATRNLLKALARRERTLPPGEVAPARRPILGFYFIGWGVPMIIVGITAAAADLKNYGGEDFCWMNFNISLAAFFGVAGLIVLVVCLMYIGISVRMGHAPSPANYDLHNHDPNTTNKDYSRSPDGIDHHMNIDSESVVTHRTDRTGVSVVSSIQDGEYTTHKQLHAAVFLLFGFLATWTFGAMAVTQAKESHFMMILFSCLYGVGAACMGIFIFTYNCALRTDVMYNWRRVCGRRRDSYAIAGSPAVQNPQPQGNGHVIQRRNSGSSIDSYNTHRSHNTNHSNHSHSLKSGSRKSTSKCNYIPSQTNTGTDASIDSSAQDTMPRAHMYEKHRGNGYSASHRNHHKVRTRPKHYRQQRYDPLAVRYVEDPTDTLDNPDASLTIPSGAESIGSGHISAPPLVLYSHREGGSLCLGYQPENVSMHSMHSMPAEPHKVPRYQDGVLLTNVPYSMPSVSHTGTAPRKQPLKVPPPMPPRTASLDRRDRSHQRQLSQSSQDESVYKPPYASPQYTSTPYGPVNRREPVEKPIYAVIRPPSRDKSQRPLSREGLSFEHQNFPPPREHSPFDTYQRLPSKQQLPISGHRGQDKSPQMGQMVQNQDRVPLAGQRVLSQDRIPLAVQRAPSQDRIPLAGQRVPSQERIPLAGQRVPSQDRISLSGQRIPSQDILPMSGQRVQSQEQLSFTGHRVQDQNPYATGQRVPNRDQIPLASQRAPQKLPEGRRPGIPDPPTYAQVRPGIPDPPTYAQVMPDPEGQVSPRVVVGQDPEMDRSFKEIDDSMAAIMAASRELLANSDNVDSDSKSDKKETSV